MSEMNFGVDNPSDDSYSDDDVSESTLLADLKAELSDDTEESTKWYPVPDKKIELAFSTNINFDTIRAAFKKATDRKTKQMNPLRLAHILLSQQSRGIKVKGHVLTKDGEPLTLVSEELQREFQTLSFATLLYKIMGSDGYSIALVQQVIEDAGYGSVDMESEDPLELG